MPISTVSAFVQCHFVGLSSTCRRGARGRLCRFGRRRFWRCGRGRASRPQRGGFWRRCRCWIRWRFVFGCGVCRRRTRCTVAFVVCARQSARCRVGFIPALAHGRADIGDIESGFVISDCGSSSSKIDGNAFDTRHFANSLFNARHAQHRQHVAHFHDARFHRNPLEEKLRPFHDLPRHSSKVDAQNICPPLEFALIFLRKDRVGLCGGTLWRKYALLHLHNQPPSNPARFNPLFM